MSAPEVIDRTLTEDNTSTSENEDAAEEHVSVADIDTESRTKLHAAIDTISPEKLRKLVMKLADKHPVIEKELCEKLLPTGRKEDPGVIQRWETCKKCEKDFDVNSKRKQFECRYHSGEMEADEDDIYAAFWNAHCDGPMATEENLKNYPEIFVWTCCEDIGTAEECKVGVHVPSERPRKRTRI